MTNDHDDRPQVDAQSDDAETVVPRDDAEGAELLEAGLESEPRAKSVMVSIEDARAQFPELEVLELLGQGGMGVVYKARQRTLDRLVALKILPTDLSRDPLFAERFQREARALARLQHPHIVGVYEVGEREGLHFLLMEYVDGVNLRQLMATNSVTPSDALSIVPQICEALHYAHAQGVVHRDIKPENVLLDRQGRVKVADFGLAKLVARGPADMTLTGTGQVMGTLHYMAPEQYKTPGDVDHRADIFSLGVVFYEMLTGELPVGRFQKPTEGLDIDQRLDEIVMRALERERELRYQSADDVKTEVGSLGSEAPASAGVGGHKAQRGKRRARRHGASFVLELGRSKKGGRAGGPADERKLHPLTFVSIALGVFSWLGTWAVAAIVRSASDEPLYTTTPYSVGMTMSAIGFGITALLAAYAAWLIRPQQSKYRGMRRSMLVVVAALVAGAFMVEQYWDAGMGARARKESDQWTARHLGKPATVVKRPPPHSAPGPATVAPPAPSSGERPLSPDDPIISRPPGLPFHDPQVVGEGLDNFRRDQIAKDVLVLWQRYGQLAWSGRSLAEKDRLISPSEWAFLNGAGGAFRGRGQDKRKPLPLWDKKDLPQPPWKMHVVSIAVDNWMTGATVTVGTPADGGPGWIKFKIKREDGRWYFTEGRIELGPTAEDEDDR